MRRVLRCFAGLLCLLLLCACENERALIPFDLAEVHRVYFPQSGITVEQPRAEAELDALLTRLAGLTRTGGGEIVQYTAQSEMVMQVYCREDDLHYMLNIYLPDFPNQADTGYCHFKLVTARGTALSEQTQTHETFFFYDPETYTMIEQSIAARTPPTP